MARPPIRLDEEPEDTEFVFIMLPAAMDPEERDARFGDPLDADLRVAGLGYVSGAGQLQSAPDEAGNSRIIYCGVDVDAVDVDAARALLREHLPELGCPPGTCIQFDDRQDRWDGGTWWLDEERREED